MHVLLHFVTYCLHHLLATHSPTLLYSSYNIMNKCAMTFPVGSLSHVNGTKSSVLCIGVEEVVCGLGDIIKNGASGVQYMTIGICYSDL
ncbi:MAG: hypothetical protein GFH27_549279n336 [Chloroflexi bacterium AL-W]|nr:hypothetical protein [Chloroflexi bacterium AL-N1]NOK65302.1 hypothetical protein [Chloroflexi bacterium AL-N10]NOK72433.1 hypothetical protein [Chloroflexi bacterium AL-N5]NOK79481.1 hypothetical protein [Chloroflexi bacterium AL-W]NOK87397.1 hypothetical protein [Chloroflexi bacterium AL-N15]